jgi:hypothetical protein
MKHALFGKCVDVRRSPVKHALFGKCVDVRRSPDVRRSHQAYVCRKRGVRKLGKPRRLLFDAKP